MDSFSLLPAELQQSIRDLRASGIPDAYLRALTDRMLEALAAKVNKAQLDVITIEDSWTARVTQIGHKLEADLKTQLGTTNGMLSDVLNGQQEAAQGIADIKKSWSAMDAWRTQVDTWRGLLSDRVEGMDGRLGSVEQSRDASIAEQRALRGMLDESGVDRKELRAMWEKLNARHETQWDEVIERIGAIERALGIAREVSE